jgi:hypothetical protein
LSREFVIAKHNESLFIMTCLTGWFATIAGGQKPALFRLVARVALVFIASLVPSAARAEVITFAGVPSQQFGPGNPTIEGNFRYDAFSGGLFGERTSFGNPPPEVEGATPTSGGILKVVRNDRSGGLFTFDGADIASHFRSDQPVTFAGYLNGVLQATDVFNTASSNVYTTVSSTNLFNVSIDELRVTLNAVPGPPVAAGEALDNLVVTPPTAAVPEPATLTLFGIGVAGVLIWGRVARLGARKSP